MENELEKRMNEIEEIQTGVDEIKKVLKNSKRRLDKLSEFFNILTNDSMSDKHWVEAMKGLNNIEDKLNG